MSARPEVSHEDIEYWLKHGTQVGVDPKTTAMEIALEALEVVVLATMARGVYVLDEQDMQAVHNAIRKLQEVV